MTMDEVFGGAMIGAQAYALSHRLAPPRRAEYTSPSFEPQRFARIA
jgi:hypothetical protein